MLEEEFKPQGYDVPTRSAPDLLIRFMGFFDSGLSLLAPLLSKVSKDKKKLFCIECILCLNIHNWNTTLIIDVIYYLARNNYISILNVSLFLMKVSCYVLPSRGFPTTYQKPWVHNTICN